MFLPGLRASRQDDVTYDFHITLAPQYFRIHTDLVKTGPLQRRPGIVRRMAVATVCLEVVGLTHSARVEPLQGEAENTPCTQASLGGCERFLESAEITQCIGGSDHIEGTGA